MSSTDSKKEKWYPGKYLAKGAEKIKSTVATSSEKSRNNSLTSPSSSSSTTNQLYASEDYDVLLDYQPQAKKLQLDGSISHDPIDQVTIQQARSSYPTALNESPHSVVLFTSKVVGDDVGAITICLSSITYVLKNKASSTANRSNKSVYIRVEVEGKYTLSSDLSSNDPLGADNTCSFGFSFKDVSSNIIITLIETVNDDGGSSYIAGRIIVPISKYLSIFSSEDTVKIEEWRYFYPINGSNTNTSAVITSDVSRFVSIHYYDSSCTDSVIDKGMVKNKVGYANIKYSIKRFKPVWQLYFHPTTSSQAASFAASSVRDMIRVSDLCAPPSFLASFLTFPEVIVVCVLWAFACFAMQLQDVPLFVFVLALVNGLLGKPSFSHIVYFNDKLVESNSRVSSCKSTGSSTAFDEWLCVTVSNVEKICNATNFSDINVSVISASMSLFVSVTLYCCIYLHLTRSLLFVLGVAVCISYTKGSTPTATVISESSSNSNSSAGTHTHISKIVNALTCFFRRIPDNLELQHRYICSSSIIGGGGFEMTKIRSKYAKLLQDKDD